MKRKKTIPVPPAAAETEDFYCDAKCAGFTLEQINFLERRFQLIEDDPKHIAMMQEHSDRCHYVAACLKAGQQPEPWEPEAKAYPRNSGTVPMVVHRSAFSWFRRLTRRQTRKAKTA